MLTIISVVDLIYLMQRVDNIVSISFHVDDKYVDDIAYIEDRALGRVLCNARHRYNEADYEGHKITFEVTLK